MSASYSNLNEMYKKTITLNPGKPEGLMCVILTEPEIILDLWIWQGHQIRPHFCDKDANPLHYT